MSKPKGSVGVALTISVLIIIAVTSVGYYQFVVCKPSSCGTTTSSSASSGGPACAPPSCLTIQIAYGAALLTTTAYAPDVAVLVIGVNNTFQVHNNDSQSGGVFHSLTSRNQTGGKPVFDTGVVGYNTTTCCFTLTTPGVYPYYCVVHPTTMVGTIIVKPGSGSPSSSSSSSTSASSTSSTSGPPPGAQISILNGASTNTTSPGFSPDSATVVIGVNSTVTWTNNDAAGHTVFFTSTPSGAKVADSDLIGPGQTFTEAFTVPGTYQYICTLHSWMKGTIIVKAG